MLIQKGQETWETIVNNVRRNVKTTWYEWSWGYWITDQTTRRLGKEHTHLEEEADNTQWHTTKQFRSTVVNYTCTCSLTINRNIVAVNNSSILHWSCWLVMAFFKGVGSTKDKHLLHVHWKSWENVFKIFHWCQSLRLEWFLSHPTML
jgi:hypothetical protein